MPTSKNMGECIRGTVDILFFSSPRFSAGKLRPKGSHSVSFCGPFLVTPKQQVVLHGKWVVHPKWGQQFEARSIEHDLELDVSGLARYLANHPELKGIGPVKARKLADKYGQDFEAALEQQSKEMAQYAGVPHDCILRVKAQWQKNKTLNMAFTWLAAYGLTHHQVTTLVDKLGNNVIGILKENPYLIVQEIKGFGFRRVDDIALKMGITKENINRIKAGLQYCINEALKNGDCWVEYDILVNRANKLLVIDSLDSIEKIESCLRKLISDGTLDGMSHCSRYLVAMPSILKMEQELAGWFASAAIPNPNPVARLEEHIQTAGPSLNDDQRTAVTSAFTHTISVISGGAGSGKTFTVATLARICKKRKLDITLAAPTGKAAKRLEEVVGMEAQTIHRLLGYDGRVFEKGPDNQIDTQVLIVDEVSMLDVPLAWQLFSAIDLQKTAVVLVGDHNQLPPVGPGNILRDLIQTNCVPKVMLRTVVRQAGVLKENSVAILRGEVQKTAKLDDGIPKPWILVNQLTEAQNLKSFLLEMFEDVIENKLGYDPVNEVQVLTPTHKGPLGARELNLDLQRLIQKKLWNIKVASPPKGRKPKVYQNDKIIWTKNNYDLDLMNGAVGRVASVGFDGTSVLDFGGRKITVAKDAPYKNDFELAYALTFHRVQGSEYPCAIVIVHKSHSFMHHRNLFYTGVTRAQKTAIVLGDRWGIRNCAEKQQVNNRNTFLSFLLAQQRSSGNGIALSLHPKKQFNECRLKKMFPPKAQ